MKLKIGDRVMTKMDVDKDTALIPYNNKIGTVTSVGTAREVYPYSVKLDGDPEPLKNMIYAKEELIPFILTEDSDGNLW